MSRVRDDAVPETVGILPPVCILAGGLGTRLGAYANGRPKALVDVNGEPFVFHQLRLLRSSGAQSVVLCVGHLGELIEASVGASRFGLDVAYSYDEPGLSGTLGAIRRARDLLGERFLVLYGDTYLQLDYRGAVAQWQRQGTEAFMSVLRNDGRWGASNADVVDGMVVAYDKWRPTPEMCWIDYGLDGLSRAVLDLRPDATDLADLWTVLAKEGTLAAVEVTERFYEIGSPEALEETRAYLAGLGGSSAEGPG